MSLTVKLDANRPLVFRARTLSEKELIGARALSFQDGRVIEHDHRSILTLGCAATITLSNGTANQEALHSVTDVLSQIAHHSDNDINASPIAIGALAFDRHAKGQLIVPEIAVIAAPNTPAVVVVVAGPKEIDDKFTSLSFSEQAMNSSSTDRQIAPDSFTLTSVRPHDDFKRRVADAVAAINDGQFEKVVLAREVTVTANKVFPQSQLLERMRVLYPSCAAFAIDGFLGASPELLCRREATQAYSYPLAGTVPRSGDPEDDARLAEQLLHSKKDLAEHAFVVDMIAGELERFSDGTVEIDGPHLLELRNVAHLATKIHIALRTDNEHRDALPNALEIAGALHPTPAVGGVPRQAALSYLQKFEEFDRDRYAGPVGYVDASGDGEWWVGIRSAVIDGATARLFAGVGIVASSDPESELIETQLKFQALLATAVRP